MLVPCAQLKGNPAIPGEGAWKAQRAAFEGLRWTRARREPARPHSISLTAIGLQKMDTIPQTLQPTFYD